MSQSTPTSARPVALGDILSFNPHPDKPEDLVECTINWQQAMKDRSEKYMVFKAKNVTAGDANFVVPVFVQKSYYDKDFGNTSEFTITEKWQYGQRNKAGADRFMVLHDQERQPYQHRFIESWLTKLSSFASVIISAVPGYGMYGKALGEVKNYLGDPLHSYNSLVVQKGDVLLVPSQLKSYAIGNPKTVQWQQMFSQKSGQYYCFTVVNATQKGQDVMFFIQKEWWDSNTISDNHISKIATKNANGEYELKLDGRCQYGQADGTGKGRWVVYHDKGRKPYQHRFIQSVLHTGIQASAAQVQAIAGCFGFNIAGLDVGKIFGFVQSYVGDYLRTFD